MNIELFYRQGVQTHRLYPRLLLLALALFVVASNGFAIAGLLPDIARSLGVRLEDAGYSITIYAVTVALAAPSISILLSRVSRTSLMSTGLLITALGTVIAALAPTLPVFVAGRVIAALGGAAVVPAATATAASLAPPERRGRAMGLVAVGFTASTALGAPLGTAVATIGGWRAPLIGIAVLGVVAASAIAVFVRRVPTAPPISFGRRLRLLKDRRLVLGLLTTVFSVASFNIVYIFSSSVVEGVTHGDRSSFALLLFLCGVAGLFGNTVAGRLTDRSGPRRVSAWFFAAMIAALALMLMVENTTMVVLSLTFVLWGFASNGLMPVIQYRLVAIDPATAGLSLSWNSTAMYVGIALAPMLGDVALRIGTPATIPLIGAAAGAISFLLFHCTWIGSRVEERAAARQ